MMSFKEAHKKVRFARCAKCHYGSHMEPRYHPAWKGDGFYIGGPAPYPEHLQWPCDTCGYAIESECADRDEPVKLEA